jgi:hypothetical protein
MSRPDASVMRHNAPMPTRSPQLQLITSTASPAEAAAIVAAVERFRAETTSPASEPENHQGRWAQTAILEGVRREDLSSWAWGDPSQME